MGVAPWKSIGSGGGVVGWVIRHPLHPGVEHRVAFAPLIGGAAPVRVGQGCRDGQRAHMGFPFEFANQGFQRVVATPGAGRFFSDQRR